MISDAEHLFVCILAILHLLWKNVCQLICVLVTQSCPTLCDPMDGSLLGSSVHGILQARIPEWVAILFSRSAWTRDWTQASCIAGRFFTPEPPQKPLSSHLPTFKSGYLFLLLSCSNSLYILDINPLSDIWFANTFSCSINCFYILLCPLMFRSFKFLWSPIHLF